MNKLSTQVIAVIVFLIVAVGALYYGGVFGNSSSSVEEAAPQQERTAEQVHILKYSDFSCPACKVYTTVETQLKAEFGDMVDIEYRHFPLDSFRHSRLAAHAAEAARNQGRFKEMHDMIFEDQEKWSPAAADARAFFTGYAEELGLDMDQFEADLESSDVHQKVESQLQEGIRRTVNSTPSFFINGQKLRQNPQSYEQFKSIVELYMYRSSN